jgi:hypothetical protein
MIIGRPGEWYVKNSEDDEPLGPYNTRKEAADNEIRPSSSALVIKIIRDQKGKISKLRVEKEEHNGDYVN